MPIFAHHGSLSANQKCAGVTLMEMMVTLVIISILAVAALPYAEVTLKRNKELELRKSLREIRTAIDAFHEDWLAGRIPKTSSAASEDGFPKDLQVLVDGVDLATAVGKKRYYMRRIPENPFADQKLSRIEQWQSRSYQDMPDATEWGGQDVYDVKVGFEREALDGSLIHEW